MRVAPARSDFLRGMAGGGRLEGHGCRKAETASSETDCTRDFALSVRRSESRVLSEAAQSGE
jgi:hypothetical protein